MFAQSTQTHSVVVAANLQQAPGHTQSATCNSLGRIHGQEQNAKAFIQDSQSQKVRRRQSERELEDW